MTNLQNTWLASACLCDHGKVAATLLHVSVRDPDCSLTADDDSEAVALGDDWREPLARVLEEMRDRTGRPISPGCSVVCGPKGRDNHALENEVVSYLYGRYDTPRH